MTNEPDEHLLSVLPPPDPAFRGEIEVAFNGSKGGTLLVNDKQVAEGRIDKTVPVVFSDRRHLRRRC